MKSYADMDIISTEVDIAFNILKHYTYNSWNQTISSNIFDNIVKIQAEEAWALMNQKDLFSPEWWELII